MRNGRKTRQKWQRSSDIVNILAGSETNTTVKIMVENTSKQTVKSKVENANKFKWPDELVEDLLKYLRQNKTTMEFKGKDFNVDEPCQNEEVKETVD